MHEHPFVSPASFLMPPPRSGLPRWLQSVVKNPPASAKDVRDTGSVPGFGRSSRGEHDNPLQYSLLENPTDRRAWRATVHRVTKSQTRLQRLSTHVPPRPDTWDRAPYFGDERASYLVNTVKSLHGLQNEAPPTPSRQAPSLAPAG